MYPQELEPHLSKCTASNLSVQDHGDRNRFAVKSQKLFNRLFLEKIVYVLSLIKTMHWLLLFALCCISSGDLFEFKQSSIVMMGPLQEKQHFIN